MLGCVAAKFPAFTETEFSSTDILVDHALRAKLWSQKTSP